MLVLINIDDTHHACSPNSSEHFTRLLQQTTFLTEEAAVGDYVVDKFQWIGPFPFHGSQLLPDIFFNDRAGVGKLARQQIDHTELFLPNFHRFGAVLQIRRTHRQVLLILNAQLSEALKFGELDLLGASQAASVLGLHDLV
jgi:hypothetical protein